MSESRNPTTPFVADEASSPTSLYRRMKCLCGHCPACTNTGHLGDAPDQRTAAGESSTGAASAAISTTATLRSLHGDDPLSHRCPAEGPRQPEIMSGLLQPQRPMHPDPTLRELLHGARRAPYSPRQLKELDKAVAAFERFRGMTPVANNGVGDVTAFVTDLQSAGTSEARVLQLVSSLSTLLRAATPEGDNPFASALRMLRRRYRPASPVRPLSNAELQLLLDSPAFIAARDTTAADESLRFWVPLTIALTGCRGRELMALRVSDVLRHAGGWALRMPAPGGHNAVRSHAPGRWVPVHDELVRCGFLAWAAGRKLQGHSHLFARRLNGFAPTTAPRSVTRWLSHLSTTVGLPAGRHTLSSLRLSFMAACLHSGMPIECVRQVTGLMPRRLTLQGLTFARHDDRVSWVTEWMGRVRFEGLEFTHLHVSEPLHAAENAFSYS